VLRRVYSVKVEGHPATLVHSCLFTSCLFGPPPFPLACSEMIGLLAPMVRAPKLVGTPKWPTNSQADEKPPRVPCHALCGTCLRVRVANTHVLRTISMYFAALGPRPGGGGMRRCTPPRASRTRERSTPGHRSGERPKRARALARGVGEVCAPPSKPTVPTTQPESDWGGMHCFWVVVCMCAGAYT